MGGSTFAGLIALLLQASEPHGVLDRWGGELGGAIAVDSYSQGSIPTVVSPLWMVELRLRSPWGVSLGVLGLLAGGTNDNAGDESTIKRKMLGFDLEYGFPFNMPVSFLPLGRGWLGAGLAAGSTTYGHADESFGSTGHVREFFFEAGVDLLLFGHAAIGPFFRAAVGDTTATVYGGLGPGGSPVGSDPGRTVYFTFNLGLRMLLVF
jgi:hypothetical protein